MRPLQMSCAPCQQSLISSSVSSSVQVDIEGVEWTVLEDYFANDTAMPFAEILIELHTLELPERWGATLMERLRHFFSEANTLFVMLSFAGSPDPRPSTRTAGELCVALHVLSPQSKDCVRHASPRPNFGPYPCRWPRTPGLPGRQQRAEPAV